MSSLQQKLQLKLVDKLINQNRGAIKTHKSLFGTHHDVCYYDWKREIIVFVAYLSEEEEKEKIKNVFNIRIKKKNPKTGAFQFLSYKERVQFDDAFYNDQSGHLVVFQY